MRIESRGTVQDQTWQDDRHDFRVLKYPLSLPEEGDYGPDLTVVDQRPKTQELYDDQIAVDGLQAFPSLYKQEPDFQFDWDKRRFDWSDDLESEIHFAVWMSDGVQER